MVKRSPQESVSSSYSVMRAFASLKERIFSSLFGMTIEISRTSLEMLLPVFSREQKPVMIDRPLPIPQVQPEWQRFEGCYVERGLGQTIEIRLTTTGLMAIIDKEGLLLLPEDDLHFRMQDGSEAGEPISFILNEEGVVTPLQVPGFRFVRR